MVIVEKTGQIGGVFADAYEGAHQVSSKYITPFSDLRLVPEVESHQSLDLRRVPPLLRGRTRPHALHAAR